MKSVFRASLLCLIGLSLAGCNSLTQTSAETLVRAVKGPPPLLSIDDVNTAARPLLLISYEQSEGSLGSPNPDQPVTEWHGLKQMLVMHNGRMVQSAGLPLDADMQQELAADDPFVTGLLNVPDGLRVERQIDFPRRHLTGLTQIATYSRGREETIEIMGEDRQVQRIDEAVRIPALDFRTNNRYWVDINTGEVLRSRQTLLPDLSPMTLTLLRPTTGGQP